MAVPVSEQNQTLAIKIFDDPLPVLELEYKEFKRSDGTLVPMGSVYTLLTYFKGVPGSTSEWGRILRRHNDIVDPFFAQQTMAYDGKVPYATMENLVTLVMYVNGTVAMAARRCIARNFCKALMTQLPDEVANSPMFSTIRNEVVDVVAIPAVSEERTNTEKSADGPGERSEGDGTQADRAEAGQEEGEPGAENGNTRRRTTRSQTTRPEVIPFCPVPSTTPSRKRKLPSANQIRAKLAKTLAEEGGSSTAPEQRTITPRNTSELGRKMTELDTVKRKLSKAVNIRVGAKHTLVQSKQKVKDLKQSLKDAEAEELGNQIVLEKATAEENKLRIQKERVEQEYNTMMNGSVHN